MANPRFGRRQSGTSPGLIALVSASRQAADGAAGDPSYPLVDFYAYDGPHGCHESDPL
ncbi:MAG: hypothetical protein QOC75_2119, partial [Pseudonocardiales bacterium]|nr:hypothetical protein [Pseudonocardiales bacterium]